jgi:DEAD/DEAH box helicase domain-containing protein
MDTLVFDIETQNFFTDPGVGWDNFSALKISVVGIYSYEKDAYFAFEENEMEKLAEFFRGSSRIVGFASNRYDIPVLSLYFQKIGAGNDLWNKERIDLLEIIESATGRRVSLSKLAEANLGTAKDHHGSEAGGLYREGKIAELKEYCLNDVRITKEIFDIFEKDHALLLPNRMTGALEKVEFVKQASTTFLF